MIEFSLTSVSVLTCATVKLLCYCCLIIIHHLLPLMLFIYLMTAAAHEEIATEGQIRGVGESDQQTLSK